MGFKEAVADAVLGAFAALTPDLRGIDSHACDYSRGEWQGIQTTAVGASGAVSTLIPGAHLVTMPADVVFLVNRMAVCAYGIGSILAKSNGKGFILEEQDMPIILARWAGDDGVSDAAIAKAAAAGSAAFAGAPIAAMLAKVAVEHTGILVGKKLGGKVGAKVASKFAAKYVGKIGGGFIPFAGPAIAGGINVYFITEMASAAYGWYSTKLRIADEFGGGFVGSLVPA